MNNIEPDWVHEPTVVPEVIKFSFDYHDHEDWVKWVPIEATIRHYGNLVDIECSIDVPGRYVRCISLKEFPLVNIEILEDQLRDYFSEIYTNFEIEFF